MILIKSVVSCIFNLYPIGIGILIPPLLQLQHSSQLDRMFALQLEPYLNAQQYPDMNESDSWSSS
jgi:hypothetical protein